MNYGNILVTGGAGFIGSQFIKKILPHSQHIYVLDNLSTGQRSAIPNSDKITFIEDSITNMKVLQLLMPKVEYIFHFACSNLLKSVDDMELDLQTNLYGQITMLQAAHLYCHDLKRYVYTSTASVYSEASIIPTPETYYNICLPYAASKFSAEHYCSVYHHMYDLPLSILRLSNVYGSGQSTANPYCGVVAKFFESALNKQPLIVYGDGLQTRDFTYIDDALDAILLAATNSLAIGELYNVGTGIETSIIDLATTIACLSEFHDFTIEHYPKRAVDVIRRRSIDARKIQKELQWKPPLSLEDGLTRTLQWLTKERHG